MKTSVTRAVNQFIYLLLIPALFFSFSSCQATGHEKTNAVDPAAVLAAYADNEPAIAWNKLAYEIADAHDHFYSFIGVRALAMSHIAMHDALNAIVPKYEPYAFTGKDSSANPVAAISQAAYEILVKAYPDKKQLLTDTLERWLNTVTGEEEKTAGIALGKQTASAITDKRNGDGYDAKGDYTPGKKPGDYQYTPGFDWVWSPDFRFAKPFALTSPHQFRSPEPPALTSTAYAESLNEVKKYGGKNSNARSEDETGYAHWWAEFGEHSWNRIGRITAAQHKLHLWKTVRMFALINMDLFDIYLASFDSKYFYDKWRPYTAIRQADTDNNPQTNPDRGWEPEMQTPPFPEYPSAHAAVGSGGAAVITHVYGTPSIDFTMESTSALKTSPTRTYHNLKKAAEDCAASRIMNGFHFRYSTEEGKIMGEKIAAWLVTHCLQPVKK